MLQHQSSEFPVANSAIDHLNNLNTDNVTTVVDVVPCFANNIIPTSLSQLRIALDYSLGQMDKFISLGSNKDFFRYCDGTYTYDGDPVRNTSDRTNALKGNDDDYDDIEHIALPPSINEGKSFRISCKKFMLTYKTHLDKKLTYDHFHTTLKSGGKSGVKFFRIAHESAHEETPYHHSHIVVEFTNTIKTTSARYFDLTIDGTVIHPNIKSISTVQYFKNCKQYIAKEDPENADLLEFKANIVEGIMACKSDQEAYINFVKKPSDMMGVKMIRDVCHKENDWYVPEFTVDDLAKWQEDLKAELDIDPPRSPPVNKDIPDKDFRFPSGADRKIIVIFCPKGGSGKSTLGTILEEDKPERYWQMQGLSSPYHVSTQISGKLNQRVWKGHVTIINLAREEANIKGMYAALEGIRDGRLMTSKNQGHSVKFNCKHVVLCVNFMIDINKLSKDKWDIRRLVDNRMVKMSFDECKLILQSQHEDKLDHVVANKEYISKAGQSIPLNLSVVPGNRYNKSHIVSIPAKATKESEAYLDDIQHQQDIAMGVAIDTPVPTFSGILSLK
jgi:hypothetical protein